MRRNSLIKILGLSLLVAVGVVAVNASAAQAKWLLLRNKVSVLEVKIKGKLLLAEFLVSSGIKIHCPSGTLTAPLVLSADHKVLTLTVAFGWTGCKVLNAPNCTVKSPGANAGEIVAKGSGTGAMTGEEVYADLSSSEFSEILIEGALCAANETDELVNGTLKLAIDEPSVDQKVHSARIIGKGLFFGEESTILHGELLGSEHDPWVVVHMEEVAGLTSALEFVEL